MDYYYFLGILRVTIFFTGLLILNVLIISFESGTQMALAISPVFNRQQIKDDPDDWVPVNYTSTSTYSGTASDCESLQVRVPFPGIEAVSYSSDGNILNATLWLFSPFKEPANNHSLRYGMIIDVASTYDQGPDYLSDIQWNSSSKTWARTIYELYSIAGERKVLDSNGTHTDFFEKGKRYVDLFSNFAQLGFPDQYKVQFFSQYNITQGDKFCVYADSTNWVSSPPPKFDITTLPSSVKLNTGEEREIQLRINSTSLVIPEVSLAASKIRDIKLVFIPTDPYVPPNGIGLSRLLIKVPDDVKPGKYNIPLIANFSFPISNSTAADSVSAEIIRYPSIIVTVESANLIEQFVRWFASFWDVFGDAISVVAGGFAGGFAGWVFTHKKLRRAKRGDKNIDPKVGQNQRKS